MLDSDVSGFVFKIILENLNLNLVWIIDKDRNNIGKKDQSNLNFIRW